MFSQPIFYELYDNWVISGYKKMMKPSCDRKDDHKSYTLNNIQLMTWADNKAKGHYNTRIGIISSGNPFKPVLQFSINGEFIAEYISTREAARQSGIHQEGISSVCNKLNRISAGGYIWKFKNQMENSK